ncbi:DUF3086 domain-containing protein [Iningainema tapete]|uniref:DUF3086 domain-containing protein n=1 Tax=Iningainema tapete BLCC-T55 TaxID=2748662 RepID=A0A8J6XD58_9CYAN|nr:DUF3086 domain-containing protein [Iningainema tapete]MBD2771068.1 DUF3086 domain-containing protein [Iningainema tapete BLCC-T55]
MNSAESQPLQPIYESLIPEEQNRTTEQKENSSVESMVVSAEQNPAVDTTQQENLTSELINNSETPSVLVEKSTTVAQTTTEESVPLEISASELEQKRFEEALLTQRVADLQRIEQKLQEEIVNLQVSYRTLTEQIDSTERGMGRLVQEAIAGLEQRKQALQLSVEQLERRQERIRNEMRTTFAGASQDLAIRVQGFKDYLTGSLQDLAAAAEQLQLVKSDRLPETPIVIKDSKPTEQPQAGTPQFAQQQFQETTKQIRRLIDQYRNTPDYYGPPWQLRRTFEPVHAERVSNWFFNQGGRGALRTMGSRLQNILIASAAISVLHKLYGDRVRTLVLANSPERLGEWRRGLQDCLGIGRPDFGPDRGVVLFETAEALAQKADRLVKANQLPFILIDDSEEQISLALLQFPLWLAFAPDPKMMRNYDDDY